MHLKIVGLFLHISELTQHDTQPDQLGLYTNIFRPAGVTEESKLPVVVVSIAIRLNYGPTVSELFLPVVLRRSFRGR